MATSTKAASAKAAPVVVETEVVETKPYLTGYAIAGLLKERGIVRPPQMMYRYIKQNLIASVIVDGQQVVERAVAEAWIDKFVAKHTA